jgi:hypothetical protein
VSKGEGADRSKGEERRGEKREGKMEICERRSRTGKPIG